MQTFYYPNIPADFSPVATTGFFDGVHQGHRAVLDKLKEVAAKYQKPSCVVTFWPHPRMVLNKETESLFLLTSLNEKKELLEKEGIDYLCIVPFTTDFARITSHTFFNDYLKEKLRVTHLVIGYDHHFGHNREAGYEAIERLGNKYDISVEKVEASKLDMVSVSSTKIRTILSEGNVSLANAYLGYSYRLTGRVVEGMRIGHQLGFPTANIQLDEPLKLIPKVGVYAVMATVNGSSRYKGMMNIGSRPTISDDFRISIEVHLFDFDHNIYGANIEVECVERTRDELKFGSMEELSEQLKADSKVVSYVLNGKK